MINKLLTIENSEFSFIKAIETKKLDDATTLWMQLTGRPKEWDFDLNDQHNYSRFTKAAIRKGEAKIRTVGGLCAGIVPIKNELNRTTSYFVYVSEASKEWKKNHEDPRDGTLTTFPKLDIEELQEHYLKFIFSQTLNKDLSENPTKPRKLKI